MMNKIKQLFANYYIELYIFLIPSVVALFYAIYNPDYEPMDKKSFFFYASIAIVVMIYSAITNRLPEKKDLYNKLKKDCFRIIYTVCMLPIVYKGELDYIFFAIMSVTLLWLLLYMTITYRRSLILSLKEEMNKIERFFLRHNLEYLILGIILITFSLLAFPSISMKQDYDLINRVFFSLNSIICFLFSITMFYIAVLCSLRCAKAVCYYYTFLVSTTALFYIVYELTIDYKGGINDNILIAMMLLMTNFTIYRCYLNLELNHSLNITK